MSRKEISIAPDGTYHIRNGKPLYKKRFYMVLKFHEPGLAPVIDKSGAYHINILGEASYEKRFQRTFGFYYNRAGVITDHGWSHIDPQGNFAYSLYYSWVGNYQEKLCVVKDHENHYFHIDLDGNRVYSQNYLYAGDYRDKIAVVRKKSGLCTHIDICGDYIHSKSFLDLDVYHKGFARARDEGGWFHVDRHGQQIYPERFMMIEPFYNGYALVHKKNGSVGILSETGEWIHAIFEGKQDI